MLIQCPECGETKYIVEPLPTFKEYRCGICQTNLIYTAAVADPEEVSGVAAIVPKIISAGILSVLLLFVMGITIALSNPNHVLASPFRGVATTVTEASAGPIALIESIRGLVATYERNVISDAVQAMRMIDDIADVPVVTMSTNDMMVFPSAENALYPFYVDKRYSQFRYTVDANGIVSVDTSGATTDALLDRIGQALDRLAGRSY